MYASSWPMNLSTKPTQCQVKREDRRNPITTHSTNIFQLLMFIYFSKGITHQRARNNYILSNDHNIEKRLKLVIGFNNNYVLYYVSCLRKRDNFRESYIRSYWSRWAPTGRCVLTVKLLHKLPFEAIKPNTTGTIFSTLTPIN
jgi:hypothetical protein